MIDYSKQGRMVASLRQKFSFIPNLGTVTQKLIKQASCGKCCGYMYTAGKNAKLIYVQVGEVSSLS